MISEILAELQYFSSSGLGFITEGKKRACLYVSLFVERGFRALCFLFLVVVFVFAVK